MVIKQKNFFGFRNLNLDISYKDGKNNSQLYLAKSNFYNVNTTYLFIFYCKNRIIYYSKSRVMAVILVELLYNIILLGNNYN